VIDPGTGWKSVSIKDLRELLTDLPDDARIGVSNLINLLVTTPDRQRMLCFIDLLSEERIMGPEH